MNDIGWALLLNLVFWIMVGSAMVLIGVLAFAELILGTEHMSRKCAGSLRKVPPHPSPESEEAEEQNREAS